MRLLDLFSGIGGFSLAAQWVWGDDLEITAFVEIDKFCQKVLRKHWPEVPIIEDIKKVEWVVADTESRETFSQESRGLHPQPGMEIRTPPIDLLTGGFPCQPFSCAGKRAGTEDDRFLWPEMLRAIHEVKPRWVVAENVPGILSLDEGMVFEGVCTDLEAEGYEVIPLVIPACAVSAPHRRDRIWIVGYTTEFRCNGLPVRGYTGTQEKRGMLKPQGTDCHAPDTEGRETFPTEQVGFHTKPCSQNRDVADSDRLNGDNAGSGSGKVPQFKEAEVSGCNFAHSNGKGLQIGKVFRRNIQSKCQAPIGNSWQEHWYEVATRFCRVDDGVSNRVDRLKSLGNAIVPQVVEQIFRAIKEIEE